MTLLHDTLAQVRRIFPRGRLASRADDGDVLAVRLPAARFGSIFRGLRPLHDGLAHLPDTPDGVADPNVHDALEQAKARGLQVELAECLDARWCACAPAEVPRAPGGAA